MLPPWERDRVRRKAGPKRRSHFIEAPVHQRLSASTSPGDERRIVDLWLRRFNPAPLLALPRVTLETGTSAQDRASISQIRPGTV